MDDKKKIVQSTYAKIAKENIGCGCCAGKEKDIANEIGYSEEEINKGKDANLGLGCGNPVALSDIKEGDIVVDLGSGAGFDCFLVSEKVGKTGKVIGIDMTEEMIEKANENAKKRKLENVEFILAEIESLPLQDNFADIIISNCVVNLSVDKNKVFKEAYRVLKNGGRIYLSDIVLLEELSDSQRTDDNLFVGCVAGALLKSDYIKKIEENGFKVEILSENKEISKKQYNGIALESLTVRAIKMDNTISFDDFKKVDLRIGKIVEADRVEKSNKLLKLRVDIGGEERQILSGIAEFYNPEDLIGKEVVMVVNLAPRKMMGLESQGMVLAAGSDIKPVILIPEEEVGSGSKIT